MRNPLLQLPPPDPSKETPVWNGREFVLGNETSRVLCYNTRSSGWNDDLTRLHEEESADGSHFIDVASRERGISALNRFAPRKERSTILEVGVSSGHFLNDLRRNFPDDVIIGADYTRGTLEEIAPRFEGIPLVQMDLTQSPFPSDGFDCIILLNVLEHIEHDDLAVAHCFRMLRPGGILVIEVPAGPGLYDDYDRELMHFRRYRRQGLIKLVSEAGFHVEEASHIGCLLYALFWLSKKLNRVRGTATESEGSRVRQAIRSSSRLGTLGHGIMRAEASLSRYLELPIGIRCTAICRKPLNSSAAL
jgi:SAM-dependent methyltransferase